MSMHEVVEHIEHAAHEGHGGGHGNVTKYIGLTMALLGVMVAFCSALVGAQRTDLIQSLVEQSTRVGLYQTESMKFRAMEANSELLKALSPEPDEEKKIAETLRSKRGASGRKDDEDTAELKDLIASSVEDLADLLTPDHHVLTDFNNIAHRYERDMKEAKEDADSYDKMIEAHQEAAEGYEYGLLFAEIGIVVASVALLLSNRIVWTVSVVLGLSCIGVTSMTYVHTRHTVEEAALKIKQAADNVVQLEKDDDTPDDSAAPVGSGAPPAASAKPAKPAKPAKAE
ncbi:MAG TPA: DUF4337 family protein [Polyangiaceae bacterium]|jgi:hypothetical protein